MSTAKTRAMRRAFWSSPVVGTACKGVERSYLFFLATVFMLLGSVNI